MYALDLPPAVPREESGKWLSLLLTLLTHGLLAFFLFVGVQWQHKVVEPVQVDLFRELLPPPPPVPPVVAPEPVRTPPPPEPEPAPRKPDIALPKPEEKAVRKPELPKPEPVRPEPQKAQPPQGLDARQQELLNRDRMELDLRKRLAAAQASSRALVQAEVASEGVRKAQADWSDLIGAKVKSNLSSTIPPGVTGYPSAEIRLELLPDRSIKEASVRIVRSTGNALLDRAIESAIYKSSPLPPPPNPDAFTRDVRFVFYPLGKP